MLFLEDAADTDVDETVKPASMLRPSGRRSVLRYGDDDGAAQVAASIWSIAAWPRDEPKRGINSEPYRPLRRCGPEELHRSLSFLLKEQTPMRKTLSTLTALLAITSVAACGEPGVANHAADSSAEQAPPEVGKANASPPVANGVASEPTPEANAGVRKEQEPKHPTAEAVFDPKNSSFVIDGRRVVLTNGLSQVAAAPGSASMITTRYFGKEVRGDLTKDGRDDLAYIITHDGGGSGQFYYVVVAINNPAGYKTTNAFLIGDRIEPQSLRITSDRLEVNFLGRERSEPMSTTPSRPSVLLLKLTPEGVLEGLMK